MILSYSVSEYRQWGNRVSLAKKLIAAFFVIWFVILCHRLIWYRTSNGECGPQPGAYAYFDNLFDALMTCLLPMVTLTVLGILIGRSIRQITQRQIVPASFGNESTHAKQSIISKIDVQLTIMLFMENFVAIISFLPYAAHLLYINITNTWPKSPLRIAWEIVIIELIRLLSYLFFSCPFYVSIISFKGFRHQFLHSIGFIRSQNNILSEIFKTTAVRATHANTKCDIHPPPIDS